jgi:hypothetical protein
MTDHTDHLAPPVVNSPNSPVYTEQVQKRIEALKEMNWDEIKDAAEVVGVSKPATSKVPWKDMADEIAIAEFTAMQLPIYVETNPALEPALTIQDEGLLETPGSLVDAVESVVRPIEESDPEVTTNVYSGQLYQDINALTCTRCNEKHHNGPQGQIICPINLDDTECPRLIEARLNA